MTAADYCNGLQHIGIPVSDLKASVKFYETLGFRKVYGHEMIHAGHELKVVFVGLQNLVLELYQYAPEAPVGRAGAVDHIAIDCTDIQALFTLLSDQGFELLDSEIQTLPFHENGVRFFAIHGPDGEKIEFNQRL